MIQQVCDTISHSHYLILLHHRLLWMIGNDYFDPLIDSVGQSTGNSIHRILTRLFILCFDWLKAEAYRLSAWVVINRKSKY